MLRVEREKYSYSKNEEGKEVRKITQDNGFSHTFIPEDSKLVVNKHDCDDLSEREIKDVLNIDLGNNQSLQTYYNNIYTNEPNCKFKLSINQTNSNNRNVIERNGHYTITDYEYDENNNLIRQTVYEKQSDQFNQYDSNGNIIGTETWGKGDYRDWELQYARLMNYEYDDQNRPVSKENILYVDTCNDYEYYDKSVEQQREDYYKANNNIFIKNQYYLNNR